MLGRDDGALNHEHIETSGDDCLPMVTDALRCQRGGGDDACGFHFLDALCHQIEIERLLVDFLHALRRRLGRERGDLLEHCVGVGVATPETFEVEDSKAAELTDFDRCGGRNDAVHRGGQQWQLNQVGTELPADIHVLGVACAPRRHDCNVVKPVGASRLFSSSDFDLHRVDRVLSASWGPWASRSR